MKTAKQLLNEMAAMYVRLEDDRADDVLEMLKRLVPEALADEARRQMREEDERNAESEGKLEFICPPKEGDLSASGKFAFIGGVWTEL